MRPHHLVIPFIVLFLGYYNPSLAQGKLEGAKKQVSKPTTGTKSSPKEDSGSESSSSSAFLAEVLMYATYGAAIGVYGLEPHLYNSLTDYPYKEDSRGNYSSLQFVPDARDFRVDIKNQFLVSDRLYGNHLELRVRPLRYFYAQVDYTELIEPKVGESGVDNLSIINTTFCYDRVRTESFNLGWLLGVRYVGGGIDQTGFVYGLQMEYFSKINISIYSSIKGGFISDRGVSEFEFSGRYHLNRMYLSAGIQSVGLSTVNFNFFSTGLGIYL